MSHRSVHFGGRNQEVSPHHDEPTIIHYNYVGSLSDASSQETDDLWFTSQELKSIQSRDRKLAKKSKQRNRKAKGTDSLRGLEEHVDVHFKEACRARIQKIRNLAKEHRGSAFDEQLRNEMISITQPSMEIAILRAKEDAIALKDDVDCKT